MRWLWLCVLFLCFGCQPMLKEGEVCGKTFSPAHSETYSTLEYNHLLDMYLPATKTDHYPDRYWVKYRKMANDETNEYVYGERQVSVETYNHYNVGDYIKFD